MVSAALSANRSRLQLLTVVLSLTILSLSLVGCAGVVSNSSGQTTPSTPSTPLAIMNVQASAATSSSVQLSWATNLPATSAIDYGTTASYGASTPVDPTMVTTHQMAITSLAAATTYHYRVRSADGSSTATSNDQMFSTAGGADTTPPTVSMTSPANGATVAGMVAMMATASDIVSVASVQFQLDGVSVGAPEAASPYSYSWDSTKTPNGSHALRAVATDGAGNTATSASVTVTVNNATNPQTFTISGTLSPAAGGAGATVTLSGASSATTTANGSGAYTFTGFANGSYTVTPSHTGFTFSPASLSATIASANVTGLNFTATAQPPATFSISGTLSPRSGRGRRDRDLERCLQRYDRSPTARAPTPLPASRTAAIPSRPATPDSLSARPRYRQRSLRPTSPA